MSSHCPLNSGDTKDICSVSGNKALVSSIPMIGGLIAGAAFKPPKFVDDLKKDVETKNNELISSVDDWRKEITALVGMNTENINSFFDTMVGTNPTDKGPDGDGYVSIVVQYYMEPLSEKIQTYGIYGTSLIAVVLSIIFLGL